MPVAALISVVLPAPLGPMRPSAAPGSTAQRDVVQRVDAAVAHADAVEDERVRHRAAPAAPERRQSAEAAGANKITTSKIRPLVTSRKSASARMTSGKIESNAAPATAPSGLVTPPITHHTRICFHARKAEVARREKVEGVRVQRAGESGDRAAERERREAHHADVDADAARGGLVLARQRDRQRELRAREREQRQRRRMPSAP